MTSLPVDCQSECHSGVECVLVTLPRRLTQTNSGSVPLLQGRGGASKQRSLVSPPLALLHLRCLSCQTPTTKRKQKKKDLLYHLFCSLSFWLPIHLGSVCLGTGGRLRWQTDRRTAVRRPQPERRQAFVEGEAGQVETQQQHKAQRQINPCTQWGFFSLLFCLFLFFGCFFFSSFFYLVGHFE